MVNSSGRKLYKELLISGLVNLPTAKGILVYSMGANPEE